MWQGTVTPSRRRTPGSIPGSPTTFLPSIKVSAPHSPRRAPEPNDPPDRSCAPHVAGATCGSLAETHCPGSIPGSPTTFLPSVKVSAPHSPGRAPGSNDPPDRSCAPGPVTIRISCQMPSKTDFCVKSLTRPGDAERLADLRAERRERHERAKSDMRRKPGIARPGGRSELKCGREHLCPQAGHGLAEAAKSPSRHAKGVPIPVGAPLVRREVGRCPACAGRRRLGGVCTAPMARQLRPLI